MARFFGSNPCDGMAINGSRVTVRVLYRVPGGPGPYPVLFWRVLVWNWKTGDLVRFCGLKAYTLLTPSPQVLDLSFAEWSDSIIPNSPLIFLDEFRMAVTPCGYEVAGLIVFNTLIPQGYPGYLQQLEFPTDLHIRLDHIYGDHHQHLEIQNKDKILIADPAQAVLAMEFRRPQAPPVMLVMRMQALIERMCSVRTDPHVPWSEWGRDAVMIEVQIDTGYMPSTFVHGAQVMVVQSLDLDDYQYHKVRTFDFSKRSTLPLRGEAGVIGRRALFEDGLSSSFQSGGGLYLNVVDLFSLSDGSLFYLVSCLPQFGCKRLRLIVMLRGTRWMRMTRTTLSGWNFGNWFEDIICLWVTLKEELVRFLGAYSFL